MFPRGLYFLLGLLSTSGCLRRLSRKLCLLGRHAEGIPTARPIYKKLHLPLAGEAFWPLFLAKVMT